MRTLFALALLLCCALVIGQCSVKIQLTSLEPLQLKFTAFNPTAFPQRVLKWGTPLEGVRTDMFDIIDERNRTLEYIGMYVRRGETPIEEEYVTIPKYGSVSKTVDLGSNYEFNSIGKFIVKLNMPLYSELKDSELDTSVAFVLERIPSRVPLPEVQGFQNCNSQQVSQTNAAVAGSRTESLRAYNCMNAYDRCVPTMTTWFGTYSDSNYNFDLVLYRNIYTRLNNYEFNAYCNAAQCDSNTYAYVYADDANYVVHLCSLFWSRTNERVNTVVHEMSHFRTLGGTNDYAYGKTACMNLAKSNPTRASRNADNVCYFSEESK